MPMIETLAQAEAREKRTSRIAAIDRFRVQQFDEVDIGSEPEWRVKDILPRTGLVLVVGEPGSAKTFVACDIAMCIASGKAWAGKQVEAGEVIYITPEGVSGFRKRLVAYREYYRPPAAIPFYLITDAADLGHNPGDAGELTRRIAEQVDDVAVVIIDTLARSMAGADENSTGDMAVMVANCDSIAKHLRCVVVLVHHLGKDVSKGARGSSVLKAAADIEITVTGQEGQRAARISKSKDGESGLEMTFSLERVELGEGMSSCVLKIESDWSFNAVEKSAPKVTGPTLIALKALQLAIDEGGEAAPPGGRINRTKMVVRSSLWRRYADQLQITASDNPDSKLKAFKRAADRLQAIGRIEVWNDFIALND
jgi:RecA-family ATPase